MLWEKKKLLRQRTVGDFNCISPALFCQNCARSAMKSGMLEPAVRPDHYMDLVADLEFPEHISKRSLFRISHLAAASPHFAV